MRRKAVRAGDEKIATIKGREQDAGAVGVAYGERQVASADFIDATGAAERRDRGNGVAAGADGAIART